MWREYVEVYPDKDDEGEARAHSNDYAGGASELVSGGECLLDEGEFRGSNSELDPRIT